RVVNMLLQVFQSASVEDAAQEARLRRQFVESQLRQNDSVLAGARVSLSDFRSRQRTYSTREKFTAQATDLTGLQARQEDLDAQRRLYASILQQLQAGAGRDGLQQLGALLSAQGASASPIVMDQYMALQRLENTRDSLTTGRWASAQTNPDVQRVDALLASARDRLQRTVSGIVSTLDDRRTALARLKAQNSAELVQIPTTDAEEARLVEREEAYRKIGDQLREELQKARLSEAATVGQVAIVDLAALPHIPVGTALVTKLIYGLLLGLFLGTGAALVTEHLNTAIRGRDDVEAVLQLPGLAVIPKFGHRGAARRRLPGSRGAGKAVERAPADELVSKTLVTVHDVHSVSAEAYRSLRTKLLFSKAITSLKSIVVTSPFAQEGKSTVAANLAATFAQHGMRVLLVDCDLRRPMQHEIFQVPGAPGLTELLAGDGLVAGTGWVTPVEGLSLIPAGTIPDDPAEMIGSAKMRTVLSRLQESFDVVVLDTPPVLPVADSAILASMADGVLLVVSAGHTNRRAAQLAVQQLQDVDARVLGVVLNDPNARVPQYDSYGYASYYGYAKR
ncbi:MAG TPA: polysaccharide biosynthesis tyrosine autokinase, partial [Gemmatimonadaceae bacterium]